MNLLSKLTSHLSSSEAESSGSSSKPANSHARRREQVRRAQRTHRERKAEYVKSLEAEVADLRAKDAANHTKLTRYAIVNGRLTALLAANNILIPPELQCVDNAAEQTSVEVCGGEAGSQYLQLSHPKSPSSYTSDPGAVDFSNPQIAIDFILALEQPCLKDFYTNPEPTGGGGHSLQLQSPIVDLAPAPKKSQEGTYWPVGSTWSIPTAQLEEQLEKLLQASKQLPLTGELTGVVCWMAIKNNPQNHKITSAKLEKLKELLAAEVDCYGFGGVIDEHVFHNIVNKVMQAS